MVIVIQPSSISLASETRLIGSGKGYRLKPGQRVVCHGEERNLEVLA